MISPLLANIYLHYAFDLWVDVWRKKCAHGDIIVVRYADDFVLGFQHRTEADRFRRELRDRLGKFGLELNSDKTRLIEFGRYAEQRRAKRGEGKPEPFDFLGLTHISGKRRDGTFKVRRKTIRKRMRAKLRGIKQQLRQRMHDPVAQTGKWLKSVVQGYFNYHAVPGNLNSLCIAARGWAKSYELPEGSPTSSSAATINQIRKALLLYTPSRPAGWVSHALFYLAGLLLLGMPTRFSVLRVLKGEDRNFLLFMFLFLLVSARGWARSYRAKAEVKDTVPKITAA